MAVVENENRATVPTLGERHRIVAPHGPFIASPAAVVKHISTDDKGRIIAAIVRIESAVSNIGAAAIQFVFSIDGPEDVPYVIF